MEQWDSKKCNDLVKEDPKNHLPYYKLAGICIEQADINGAKENLLKVYELAPDFLPDKVHLPLAEIFEGVKDWTNALKHYKILYKVAADKFPMLIKIGKCF